MHIKDFFDLSLLEQILDDWTKATGMAAIAVDNEGNYLTDAFGLSDFCSRYTKGDLDEWKRSSRSGSDSAIFSVQSGLTNFATDIIVAGSYLGRIIGGQVIVGDGEDEQLESIATAANADIDAVREVPVKSEEAVHSAVKLLGDMVNLIVSSEYNKTNSSDLVATLENDISQAVDLIEEINEKSLALDKIESKQKILSLNASIEAARAGEFGRGFAVVASEFGKLAVNSGEINRSIKSSLKTLTAVIDEMEESSQK